MALGTKLAFPFFEGIASVQGTRFDVALGGHGYMVDTDLHDEWGSAPLDMIRAQADTADQPAETTLNPHGPWRRAADNWCHGAGQDWLDKPDSNRARFRTSKGVDPWTKSALTLLPDTSRVASTLFTNLHLATTDTRLYWGAGQGISRSDASSLAAFTACTGEPADDLTSMCSDGATVYAGFTASGIYKTTGTVFASWATGTVGLVRFANGRVIAANGPALYNPTTAGALSAFFTHPTATWTWTDATEGQGCIYISGYAGDKSMVYKTSIKPDGTALDIPVVAARLPDGETALSVTGYQGFVLIGTSKGVRFAVDSGDGYLTLGALRPTTSPVLCAEGQDRFVWFGLTNYDSVSTGLGRLDLSVFTGPQTPAYASDLMATAQGTVTAVVTFLGKRVYGVAADGIWAEQTAKVASGTLSSGKVGFGIPDQKTALTLAEQHDPLPATAQVEMFLAADNATAISVGVSELDGSSVSSADSFVLNQRRGAFFEWTAVLTGDMTLRRITLRADPSSERTIIHTVPLLLTDRVGDGPVQVPVDVVAEKAHLVGLCVSREVINYQQAGETVRVVLEDFQWRPTRKRTANKSGLQGTFIARLKEV